MIEPATTRKRKAAYAQPLIDGGGMDGSVGVD
jgi:hypothetical protein